MMSEYIHLFRGAPLACLDEQLFILAMYDGFIPVHVPEKRTIHMRHPERKKEIFILENKGNNFHLTLGYNKDWNELIRVAAKFDTSTEMGEMELLYRDECFGRRTTLMNSILSNNLAQAVERLALFIVWAAVKTGEQPAR